MNRILKGNEIAAKLPPKHGQAREDMILDLVRSGNVVLRWTPIKIYHEGKKYTFYVTAEPLMLGDAWDDAFYPGVSAITLQKIADHYNATLLTPKLVDEIWNQAKFRVDPIVAWQNMLDAGISKDATMVDTASMVFHSDLVKRRIAAAREMKGKRAPLIANVGKYWVVNAATSRRVKSQEAPNFDAGINYGWHKSKPGVSGQTVTLQKDTDIWQPPGNRHPLSHSDYSQLVMLVSRTVKVCEPLSAGLGAIYNCKPDKACKTKGVAGRIRCMDIYDLAQDQKLAQIVSHEGTINMRIPSVPFEAPPSCAAQALSGPNPDWVEYEDDPDERDEPMSGLGESPYVALSRRSAFGDDLCGKVPPPTRTVGSGRPAPGKAPTSERPKRGPLDAFTFTPGVATALVGGLAAMIGFSLYLQRHDKSS